LGVYVLTNCVVHRTKGYVVLLGGPEDEPNHFQGQSHGQLYEVLRQEGRRTGLRDRVPATRTTLKDGVLTTRETFWIGRVLEARKPFQSGVLATRATFWNGIPATRATTFGVLSLRTIFF
jgi:hypothetical protein